jgi:hypothetical protein
MAAKQAFTRRPARPMIRTIAMPQMIHYQDDLFFLSLLVKALDAGLATDADPEYFRERVAGDLFFLDGSIRTFQALLSQNAQLLERPECLKLLEGIGKTFSRVLDGLARGSYPGSAAYSPYKPQIEALLAGQRTLLAELDKLLYVTLEGEGESDLVSPDELSELLKD